MKNYDWLRRHAAMLGRYTQLKKNLYGFLFLGLGILSSCEQHSCGDGPEPANYCGTFVTVEENACWDGYMGSKWLRLDNGELLLPQGSSVDVSNLQAGQRLKIGFETIAQEPAYSIICNYITKPEEPSRAIKITCVEPIGFCGTVPNPPANPAVCNTYATAENVICGAGVWANTWLRLDDGTLLQPWESSFYSVQLVPGQRYKLAFELMKRDNRYNNAVICQAVPPAADAARITCLEAEEQTEQTGK